MSEQITHATLVADGFESGRHPTETYFKWLLKGYTLLRCWFDDNGVFVVSFEGVRNDCTFSGLETMEELHKLISWLPEL